MVVETRQGETEECLLIYVPYPCLKVMKNAHELLVPELEKHLS